MKSTGCSILIAITLAVLLSVQTAVAGPTQQSPPGGTGGGGGAGANNQPATKPRVTDVWLWPRHDSGNHSFQLGEWMTVKVDHLRDLASDQTKCKQVALYLNDLRLDGLPQECSLTDGTNGTDGRIIFHLVRGDATAAATWSTVLGNPSADETQVDVSVGMKGSDPIASDKHVMLHVYHPKALAYLPGIVLLVFIIFFFSGGLLRDSVPELKGEQINQRPYSLSRCQLAGWLILIVGAYFLVWISTGDTPVMTQQLLALLGVAGGATVGGLAINSAKNDQRSSATAAAGMPSPPPIAVANAQAAAAPVLVVPPPPPPPPATVLVVPQHRNFFFDILSENGALSVTRLQYAVWTLVLWALFCVSVYRAFGLLDFDKTLLGLMGLSSLTYVGSKPAEGPKTP